MIRSNSGVHNWIRAFSICFAVSHCCVSWADETSTETLLKRGEAIYRQQCADCHGGQGEGVDSAYEQPLVGDDSIGQLAATIADTMPEGEPELCTGDDAKAVAEYIHFSFYSEAAQIRRRPPRVGLARLTAEQLRQSMADIFRSFGWDTKLPEERGLLARYEDGDRKREDRKRVERTDAVIDFDFGRDSPAEGITPDAFNISWNGGLLIEESGRYEIIVESTCSFVMNFGDRSRELIDNHVQSGDRTEFRRTLELTGGRVYPLNIEFRQRERKTEIPPARISLRWVTPGGVERVIPNRNLIPQNVPAAYALQTDLPPDDRSYGFERGISINREWDESTTKAAIEMADIAFDELWPNYQRQHRKDSNENRKQLKDFLSQLLTTAFRGDFDASTRTSLVDDQVDAELDDREAIKRVLLLGLKAPRFLYPGLDAHMSDSQRAANQLSLVLFDSLPQDSEMRRLVESNELADEKQIRAYVARVTNDLRLRAKTRAFLHQWLNVGHIGDISKNQELYPGFDADLLYDMRRSLDAFIDDVVWENGSDYRQLFLADWSYTTPSMAEALGEAWQASFDDASPAGQLVKTGSNARARAGVLTHPYLMSGLSYFDSTSPIHRGVFLIRHVLGRTLRPPNEAFTPLSPALHPDLTTRERVTLQTSPESCQVCHSRINALGFALENFDAIGRFRTEERNKALDVRGSYVDRLGNLVEFEGQRELAEYLASSSDAHTAFVRRAFQHFVKQPPAAYGPDTLDELTADFVASDFNIVHLIQEIAVIAAKHAANRQPVDLVSNP